MINHFWTLLLNKSGADVLTGIPGSELVDPNFVAVLDSSEAARVRSILFGPDPDYYGMIFRAQQLIRLLNAFGWQEELVRYDTRTSYVRPTLTSPEFFKKPEYSVVKPTGTTGILRLQDKVYEDNRAGRLRWQWTVTIEDPGTVSAVVAHNNSIANFQNYTLTSGTSSPLVLPGISTTFVLESPEVGDQWLIDASLKPAVTMIDIAEAIVNLPDPLVRALAGDTTQEPGATFYNVWSTHPEYLNRLAAVVCALVFSTNKVLA